MALKETVILFCFSLLTLSASSQSQRYAEDSINAQQLIANKLKHLETVGVVNYLYLFSDAGTIVILYEVDGKIKGTKCYYKGKLGSDFRNLRLTKEDKVNYGKCIEMAKMDTTINFSNCKNFVHSFNRITFSANTSKHYIKGIFTSDCTDMLDRKGMYQLHSIYKHLLGFK
ncbi:MULTISPECIES: hypothetical protein [unclassified Chitinophaga]|uniref:hypothetical protein n=1 Tax=unclassified Chitinophaga TaxID=2619133 RepID=UPI00300FA0B0